MTKDKHFIFKALTFAVFCIFLLPNLGKEGLFVDGVTYGAIARNLAIGKGSFWIPYYTDTLYANFIEHPPLALNIQSVFFRVFGDIHWIERFHSLFLVVLSAFGIGLVWRTALPKFKDYFWLPLVLWIIIPTVSWSFSNNMLENTVVVFSVFSVYFAHRALETENLAFKWIFVSALFLLFAFLSKGIATLFPLAVFACYALSHIQFSKKIILSQIWLITFFLLLFLSLITFIPAAKENIYQSISKQFNSTQNVVTTGSRLFILGKLFLDLLPIWLLAGGVLGWKYLKQKTYFSKNSETLKMSVFWLLIGFSGILPIMISTKQSGYYIIPASMFFVLGLSSAVLPAITLILQKLSNQSWFRYLSILSFSIIAFSFSSMVGNWNSYNRDKNLAEDIKKIGQIVDYDTITMQQDYKSKWLLHAYFMRYEKISLDETNQLTYYVGEKGVDEPNDDYKKVGLDLKELVLFEKVKKD